MLARCRLMVISSIMEGGANVVSEALAASVPVIASDIPGNIGMLGADYAGFYPCGDERALADLLHRAETSVEFYDLLKAQCTKRKRLVEPDQELAGLEQLIASVKPISSPDGQALRRAQAKLLEIEVALLIERTSIMLAVRVE